MEKRDSMIDLFRKKRLPWIVMGIICSLVAMIPFFVLGKDSIITYHDQLDGEIITYILNAKHLFDGNTFYPELMNGISKNGVASPAPLFILLFRFFSPFNAFLICLVIVKLTAFVSMFLLVDELTDMKLLSFIIAIAFMLLPFYAVYGLCIPGQPMVYFALRKLKEEKFCWPVYFLLIIYGLCSSLALTGFAVLSVLLVVFIYSLIARKNPFRFALAGFVLGLTYLLENVSLVKQVLGLTDGFVSHKSEIVRKGVLFPSAFWNLLTTGADYTKAYQLYYLPVIMLAIIAGGIYLLLTAGSKELFEKVYKNIGISSFFIVAIAGVSAFFDSKAFVKYSNSKAGVIHDFNFDRFSWLLTVFWFVLLAYSIKLLVMMARNANHSSLAQFACVLFVSTSLAVSSGCAVMNSDLKPNLMKMFRHGDYYMMTWRQFYAEDLFEEVDELIGREKEEYRVVSLGIYPAAAAYNGFYCLDAYSNNYDVNYKHDFREVIAPQINRSEYLSEWFDKWGNRCYITLYENMNYYSVEKKWGNYTDDYELNFTKLRELGCEYIISAEYLLNPEEHGLRLLNKGEESIETPSSWYRLFVYKIM